MRKTMSMQQLAILPVMACVLAYGCTQPDYEYQYVLPPGWFWAYIEDGKCINNSGAVVGTGAGKNGHYKVFLCSEGVYTDITPPGYRAARAKSINDSGTWVGKGIDRSRRDKSFIATPRIPAE